MCVRMRHRSIGLIKNVDKIILHGCFMLHVEAKLTVHGELVISLFYGREVQERRRYTNCSIIIQLKQQDG